MLGVLTNAQRIRTETRRLFNTKNLDINVQIFTIIQLK